MTDTEHKPDRDQLKPNDFPLQAEKDEVKRQNGKPVAKTKTEEMAEDVAGRLNCDEHHREEDRWSA